MCGQAGGGAIETQWIWSDAMRALVKVTSNPRKSNLTIHVHPDYCKLRHDHYRIEMYDVTQQCMRLFYQNRERGLPVAYWGAPYQRYYPGLLEELGINYWQTPKGRFSFHRTKERTKEDYLIKSGRRKVRRPSLNPAAYQTFLFSL